ncbi:CAP domain-containing protein [Neotabrizicola shimadae]|uniref:SCP domain-containing protein n=1 Tax=Neotabrizicola shimadae TaxID=2807096 RepID=A0A8G0ZW18_9RHOB|nr:CAP domain-containing protein [Neotabrizicola shimadae]QYZ71238.1 hypothetical protein JO391_06960 [Neotabrizicola shimadae]
MALSATEQYLLELINRARLDPAGEAARLGIDLNSGLSPGTISASAKQVLAPNALLDQAATSHSLWMLQTDTFSHTGSGGSTPGTRATTAGYKWSILGENISYRGTTGTVDAAAYIEQQHYDLFKSSGHRLNMLNSSYREIGVSQELGQFTSGSTTFNASMVTELFGTSGSASFVTGVAYADRDKDGFYSIGEGRSGVSLNAAGQGTSTAEAGGYAIAVSSSAISSAVAVTGTVGAQAFSVTLDLTSGNAKLDIVGAQMLLSSVDIDLVSGIQNARLLGVAAIDATGTDLANRLIGNSGANTISGQGGNDTLLGSGGNDVLLGGRGNDRLVGGPGRDTFVFGPDMGIDEVSDFSPTLDRLRLDDVIWGAGHSAQSLVSTFAEVTARGVLFDFDPSNQILLVGLTSTSNLDALIDII